MGSFRKDQNQSKNSKKLSKNKSIKLYREKQSKIQQFQKEVEALKQKYNEIDSQKIQKFDDFPLSEKTCKGLKKAGYVIPTEIQKDSIGLALKGHDILGAAKTGSGKTLAFIIPILESLYCAGWSIPFGLGALVITPTRELAYQIFEVLNKVGSFHNFSAALVIGGKDLAKERKLLNKGNILICTPGRLLQHMDENDLFDVTNLRMLILDEADRILDLGFEPTVNAILENLPIERQTLLFSATQTRSVKDLARLSLKNPVYISVHEHAKYSTPEGLTQNYLVCEAHSKLNLLWSFIKSHKQQKILVFVATCKQVKFLQESIIRLKPHVEILAMHGRLHQLQRIHIYDEFCRKNHVVLFATDVAARGLDFPNVNWVVQLDCPEDTNTYIHRAGRTARYQKNGQSLLVLLPSEKQSMIEQLKQRKIPIEEQIVDPGKIYNMQRKLEAICARDVNLKNSAQRAYRSYIKNIFLMKDETIFDVNKIDLEKYAKSLGLVTSPRLRFLKKKTIQAETPQDPLINNTLESESDDDDLLKPKGDPELPCLVESEVDEPIEPKKLITKAAVAKRILKKKIKANMVMKFDSEGNPIREVCGTAVPVVASEIQNSILEEGYSIEKAKLLKEKEEEVDKIIFRERVKQKHRDERLKLKAKRKKELGDAPQLADTDKDKEESDSESEIDPNDILSQNAKEDEDVESDSDNQEQSSSEAEQSDDESEEEFDNRKKRKNVSDTRDGKKLKKDLNFSDVGHSLDEEADLALHFLSNS